MELKYYLSILRRRWMPFLMVPMMVGLFVMMQIIGADTTYSASAQLSVTRAPQQLEIDDFRYNEYYLFLSSEFLIDDLVEIVHGNVFAQDVHQRLLDEQGVDISAGEIQGSITADRQHRILTIDVSSHDPDRAVLIARAATDQLHADATRYFGFGEDERSAVVEPVQIAEHAGPSMGRDQVFWALQLAVALFGGVLLAFFIEYLDDRMHSSEMVEHALGLDVIAEVPRGKVD